MDRKTERFYAELWPHRAVVLRTAQLLTRDNALAEDLAQETLLKAFAAIERFEAGTDARAWLVSILRNARIDHARQHARRARDVSLEQLAEDPAAEEIDGPANSATSSIDPRDILEAFSDQQVIDALGALPEEIRWTLLLVDVEQMDHHDAARILDVPVGTIKSRAHRGRAMLRRRLSSHSAARKDM